MKKTFCVTFALVVLHAFVFAQITATPQVVCGTSNVTLSIPAQPGSTYQWQSSSTQGGTYIDILGATAVTYSTNTVGWYRVMINPSGNATSEFELIVNPKPIPDFTFDNDNTCSGTAIQFTSSVASGNPGYTYNWNFGDGNTSTLQNPTHTYVSLGCGTGNFNTTLTVTDSYGCSNITVHTITVKQKPEVQVADANIFSPFKNCDNNPTTANPNYTIIINNASPNAGCITSYTLDWGDGNIQSNVTFPLTHTYTQLGAFNLIVSAIGVNGCTNSKTYQVANQSNPDIGIGTFGGTIGCAPLSINIILTTWQANSPGTTYLLEYGDGSTTSLTHPINPGNTNDTLIHTYTTSSCPGLPTYQLKITATNGCKSKSFQGGDIEVRMKAQSNFIIAPSPACVGQSVCFTNTTIAGFWANCSTAGTTSWDFGDPTSGSNTSTQTSPCHIYTVAGTYTITLSTTNPCGTSTITKQVCINTPLVPSFTVDNSTGCAPVTVNTTNTTNNGTNCSAPTYLWTVTYAATNCGTVSSYSFTNGTTSTSVSPSFIFNNAGTYTIKLAATNSCGTFSVTQNIIVKKPPTVTIATLPNTCGITSINPVAIATNCGTGTLTYAWSFPGGSPATSTSPTPSSIYNTPGSYTISVDVTNECGTTTATQTFTVKPIPDFASPPNVSLCPGNNFAGYTLTSTPVGTFGWVNNNPAIGLAATGSGNIPGFVATNTTASPITATVTITATLNLCTKINTFTITVNPNPLAPTASSPVNYCKDAVAVALTATPTPGNTLHWYTVATGGTELPAAPIPSTTTVGATDYWVSQSTTTPANCEGPRTKITVNVYAIPSIVATSTNPATCGGNSGTIVITGLSANTIYQLSYTKNGSPVNISPTSNASGTITITGLSAGIYDNIIVTLNGCPSNAAGPFTLIDPSAPAAPTAGNDGPLCTGTTLHLTASTISGATYTWTGPASYTGSTQSPTISNVTLLEAGVYNVTATVSGCTSLPATTTVVVNPTPSLPAVGNNGPVCENNTILLTVSSSAGATYVWTGPNGFSDNTQNPSITNATIAASGNYLVVATLGTCTNSNSTSVTVKPTPNIVSASATDPTNCASSTGSIILNGLANNITYIFSYLKNGAPQTGNVTANGTGTGTITNLGAGIYTNIMVTLAGCPSNMVGPFTLSDPNPPPAPTAGYTGGPLCSGKSLQLTASTIAGASYSWTGPASFTSSLQNPLINNITVAMAGIYSVTATVTGCTSPPATVTVVIDPSPIITSKISNSPVCTGNTLSLSTTSSTPGLLGYLWNGPNSFTSTNASTTIPNVTTAAAGKYYIQITLGTCSTLDSLNVIVNATPIIIDSSKTDPTSCSSSTGTIILKGLVPNTVYTVSYTKAPASATNLSLTADATGKIIIPALSSGTYSNIFVSLNSCPSLPVGPFTLTDPSPPATPVATSNAPICSGNTLTLNASTTSTGAALYNWTGPNSFTSGIQSPSITNVTTAANGIYLVTATINNCVSAPGSIPVVIYSLPPIPIVSTPVTYCINTTAVPLSATVTTAGNSLLWYTVATGGAGSATAPTPSTSVAGNTDYYVSQKSSVGCEGPRTLIRATVNPDAKALLAPTVTISCPPFQITPQVIGLQTFPANNTYNWYANNIFIGSGLIFPGYTIANENDSVIIKLVTLSALGCKADSMSSKFYTYKLPHPSFAKSIVTGCGPLTVQFTNTTPFITDFTYQWNFGNGQTSTLPQPGPIVFQPNPNFNDTTYIIQLKIVTPCQTVIYKDSVLVHSKPKALFTPSTVNGCSPMKVKFTNTSLGIGNTFYWNFDDGQTFTTTLKDTFTHIFYTGVIDTFHVKLKVVNSCGSDSITYLIITAPNSIHLNFSMNGTSQYGCAPHTVAFYNNSIGAGSFLWNFGDGNTTTTTNNIDTVYHTYNLPGAFTVNLTAVNNCTDTTGQTFVTVYAKPVPAFIASSYNSCIGQSIQFTDNSTGAGSRQWSFGDGSFSSVLNPVHTYSTPGLYTVKLIAYNSNPSGNVCSDSITRQIQVVATLTGNITTSGDVGTCAPFTVSFVNHNLPSVTTVWDFGDGNFGSGDNISHTYTTAGTYSVHVTVTVPGGCVYLTDKIITVGGPAGTLQYAPGFNCYPLPIFLQVSATNATGYVWDFGDGNTQTTTSAFVYHLYNNPGRYVPKVTLQGAQGCNIMLQGLDTIKVDKIIAGFTITQSSNCGSTSITFADTSHAYFGKALIKWNFGDGQSGTGATVTHPYTSSGNYVIDQIVIGSSGCADTLHRNIAIFVKHTPVTNISGPSESCSLQTVTFNANINSVDTVNITSWKLSNGASGTEKSFVYNFTTPGNYTLQLITGTVYGCFDTAYHSITIKPIPTVIASGDVTLCLGNSAILSVTGNASTYQWTPLQGLSCTSCLNPTASPLVTTAYVVAGVNNFGCTVFDTVIVTVIQPMNLQVSGNDSICIGQSTLLQAAGAATYIWSPAIGLSSTTISNPVASPINTTIYRVIGYDGHNCYTDTAFIVVAIGQYPTVSLGADVTLATGVQYPLKTQVSNGPISQWLWTPSVDLNCSACSLPIANIKKDVTYVVKVTTAYGCSASDTLNIKVFCSNAQVFIANGFTPDGDGVNDVLTVRATGIAMVKHFRIFNRWGVVVFERENFPPNNSAYAWNGKVNGKDVPPDIFVYTAEVICENGSSYTYKGNISLIK